jgi:hypothetical protein
VVGGNESREASAQDVQLLPRFEKALDMQLDLHIDLLARVARHAADDQHVPVLFGALGVEAGRETVLDKKWVESRQVGVVDRPRLRVLKEPAQSLDQRRQRGADLTGEGVEMRRAQGTEGLGACGADDTCAGEEAEPRTIAQRAISLSIR